MATALEKVIDSIASNPETTAIIAIFTFLLVDEILSSLMDKGKV